jgi:hypothetical protein
MVTFVLQEVNLCFDSKWEFIFSFKKGVVVFFDSFSVL